MHIQQGGFDVYLNFDSNKTFVRISCVKKLYDPCSSRYFTFSPIQYLQYVLLCSPYFSQIFHPAGRMFLGTSKWQLRLVGIDKLQPLVVLGPG